MRNVHSTVYHQDVFDGTVYGFRDRGIHFLLGMTYFSLATKRHLNNEQASNLQRECPALYPQEFREQYVEYFLENLLKKGKTYNCLKGVPFKFFQPLHKVYVVISCVWAESQKEASNGNSSGNSENSGTQPGTQKRN